MLNRLLGLVGTDVNSAIAYDLKSLQIYIGWQ